MAKAPEPTWFLGILVAIAIAVFGGGFLYLHKDISAARANIVEARRDLARIRADLYEINKQVAGIREDAAKTNGTLDTLVQVTSKVGSKQGPPRSP
jgi:hypothetical protein